jgi:hypothetical protein
MSDERRRIVNWAIVVAAAVVVTVLQVLAGPAVWVLALILRIAILLGLGATIVLVSNGSRDGRRRSSMGPEQCSCWRSSYRFCCRSCCSHRSSCWLWSAGARS